MSTSTHPNDLERLALSAADVGLLLDISERHVWSMHSAGRLPRPFRLGRVTRWRLGELKAWVDAGCPERQRWEQLQQGGQR